jgi:hypothetical protein
VPSSVVALPKIAPSSTSPIQRSSPTATMRSSTNWKCVRRMCATLESAAASAIRVSNGSRTAAPPPPRSTGTLIAPRRARRTRSIASWGGLTARLRSAAPAPISASSAASSADPGRTAEITSPDMRAPS